MEPFTAEFRALHQNDDIDRIEETVAKLEREQFPEMDGRVFSGGATHSPSRRKEVLVSYNRRRTASPVNTVA